MVDWKRKRLGPSYTIGVQRRQVRVGKPGEPVVVVRVVEGLKPGDELILTRRVVQFAASGVEFELRRAA